MYKDFNKYLIAPTQFYKNTSIYISLRYRKVHDEAMLGLGIWNLSGENSVFEVQLISAFHLLLVLKSGWMAACALL